MNLKILIAEDKPEQIQSTIEACLCYSEEEGFNIDESNIITASTIKETEVLLKSKPFNFDIVILDIGFGEDDLNVEKIAGYLKADTLAESKVIIHTGNNDFQDNPEKILTAIGNGVRAIAIKGQTIGVNCFEIQFKRILRDLKYETLWANIGRFAPHWKRNMFRKDDLWKELIKGKKVDKILLLLDISSSTTFVQKQREISKDDKHIFELFKSFANMSTEIIEKDRYKGIVERYSGDEILAYFDFENPSTDILNVIECAKELNSQFNNNIERLYRTYNFQDFFNGDFKIRPQLRILISCGEITWVLLGAESRPQLSVMTDKVAKFYRSFTDRDKVNKVRSLEPNKIYITEDALYYFEEKIKMDLFPEPQILNLNNFGNYKVYSLKQ